MALKRIIRTEIQIKSRSEMSEATKRMEDNEIRRLNQIARRVGLGWLGVKLVVGLVGTPKCLS